MECVAADCHRPVARAGLCWTHYRQLRDGKAVLTVIRERAATPYEAVEEAARAFVDVEDRVGEPNATEFYQRAKWRFRAALERWRRHANRRLPHGAGGSGG